MECCEGFLNLVLNKRKNLYGAKEINIELFGSLAKTGKGHGTDKSIMMGLMGFNVHDFDSNLLSHYLDEIASEGKINLLNKVKIQFDSKKYKI